MKARAAELHARVCVCVRTNEINVRVGKRMKGKIKSNRNNVKVKRFNGSLKPATHYKVTPSLRP